MSDPWKGDTGLLDNYVFDVREAWFGYTDYNNGETALLLLKGEATTEDGEIIPDHQEQYSIGGGFEPADDGKKAIHETGDERKNFNTKSGVMDLVRSALECGVPLRARAETPKEAKIWPGLKLRMERKSFGTFTTKEGEEREYFRSVPVEFLGESGEGAATPTATTNASGDEAKRVIQAKKAAKEETEYYGWLEKAVELGFEVDDERVAETGPNSIWAQAH